MADDADDEFERHGRYVMPILPENLKVDPLFAALLHLASFVELSGEDVLDFDWSLEVNEHVAYFLEQLPNSRATELQAQLEVAAKHVRRKQKDPEAAEFIRDFLRACGVGEVDEE